MKIVNCDQRSNEWYEARLGIPTASAFGKIVAPSGKERKGATPLSYMLSLLGERLTRTPTIVRESAAMLRGRELEAYARRYYEEKTGQHVEEVGFITSDDGRWGCSPDGLCEMNGIEIKCPLLPGFLSFAVTGDIPDDHFMQMQACMWITGKHVWDYVVFTDVRGLRPVIRSVQADQRVFDALDVALPRFCDELDAREKDMRADGHGVPTNMALDLSALDEEWTVGNEQQIAEVNND